MTRLLILAGSHEQAAHEARERGLAPQQWRYVADARDIYGVRDEPYIIVGTFWDRRDAGELLALARARLAPQERRDKEGTE